MKTEAPPRRVPRAWILAGVLLVGLLALGIVTGRMRWIAVSITLGLLFGVCGALVGDLVAWALKRPPAMLRRVLAFVFVLGLLQITPLQERAVEAVEAVFPTEAGQLARRLGRFPVLKRWVLTSRVSADERRARMTAMADAGVLRLDDRPMVDRARLMSELLDAADTRTCAALARGDASGMPALLTRVPATTREAFHHMLWTAMEADLRRAPRRSYPREALLAARDAALAGLDETAMERVTTAMTDPSAAPDADLCLAWRTLHRAVPRLDGVQRQVLASLVAGVH